MAFFEQLGKRLTDAGQNVAQQTKNLADVTQLNSAISDREKKISQLYLSIGQQYYESHKGDLSAEHRELINEINTLQAENEQNREKIKQIKGVVKCPHCGADVPLNAAFCSICGTKMIQSVPPATVNVEDNDVRYCPKCHAAVAADNLFCNVCGTKIENGEERQQ